MSVLMLLALGKKPYVPPLTTRTFTTSQSVIIPDGVTVLESVKGKGAAGKPATSGTTTFSTRIVTTLYRRDVGTDVVTENANGWIGANGATGTGSGQDYCEPMQQTNSSTVYYQSQKCFYYTRTTSSGTSATVGASATGFNKVFPGGSGGPATEVSFANVAVTPKQSYPLVIPSGGSITITYRV